MKKTKLNPKHLYAIFAFLLSAVVVFCGVQIWQEYSNRQKDIDAFAELSELAEIKEREHLEKISDIKGEQLKIEWGSQIRSYVFMPYTLVKDTRTGCETSNVNAVMDGALDPFIESYLNCLAPGSWVQK